MEDMQIRQDSAKVILMGVSLIFFRLLLPAKYYNKIVYKMICGLSPINKKLHVENFIDTFRLTKKRSAGFRNSYKEADAMVSNMPLLKPYYKNVYGIVREHRLKHKLMP